MKNKVLAILLAVIIPLNAFADTKTVIKGKLVGLGMSSELSNYIANTLTNGDVSYDNADYLKWRNAAGTADISVLRVTSGDETVLNADTGDAIHFAIAGTNTIDFDGTDFTPTTTDGVNLGSAAASFNNGWFTGDVTTFGAGNGLLGSSNSSVTSLDADVTTRTTAQPPIAGVTAATVASAAAFVANAAASGGNEFFFFKTRAAATATNANTIVAVNDNVMDLKAFAADGVDYQPVANIQMNVASTAVGAGDVGGNIVFKTTPDGSSTLATVLTLDQDKSALFTGTVRSSATADIGWAVVDTADNAACTTGCTSAAVFGINLAAGATAPVIVGPADATADVCLCAGAS